MIITDKYPSCVIRFMVPGGSLVFFLGFFFFDSIFSQMMRQEILNSWYLIWYPDCPCSGINLSTSYLFSLLFWSFLAFSLFFLSPSAPSIANLWGINLFWLMLWESIMVGKAAYLCVYNLEVKRDKCFCSTQFLFFPLYSLWDHGLWDGSSLSC